MLEVIPSHSCPKPTPNPKEVPGSQSLIMGREEGPADPAKQTSLRDSSARVLFPLRSILTASVHLQETTLHSSFTLKEVADKSLGAPRLSTPFLAILEDIRLNHQWNHQWWDFRSWWLRRLGGGVGWGVVGSPGVHSTSLGDGLCPLYCCHLFSPSSQAFFLLYAQAFPHSVESQEADLILRGYPESSPFFFASISSSGRAPHSPYFLGIL